MSDGDVVVCLNLLKRSSRCGASVAPKVPDHFRWEG